MSAYVRGNNVSDAWIKAFEVLSRNTGSAAVNLAVSIDNPGEEITGVRQAIDFRVAELKAMGKNGFNKSVHTVANTIFPISLYQPGRAISFYETALQGQSGRDGFVTSWGPNSGTYIGRLLDYPTHGGESFNQVERILTNLNAERNYQDFYEISLTSEASDANRADTSISSSASTFVPNYDNRSRGGQCLSHISLHLSPGGELSMTALYRHQTYITRAYGNFLGLARLLHFLVRECDKDIRVGELMVVASHAEIDAAGRRGCNSLLTQCQSHLEDETAEIEWHSRPFGSRWADLNLPQVSV